MNPETDAPLCTKHAQIWFTACNGVKTVSGCLFCDMENGITHNRLPAERASITHKFRVEEQKGYLTVGLYPDGTLGEVFLTVDREGSFTRTLLSCWAIAISMMLQHGMPLSKIVEKFKGVRSEPSGLTGNPAIPMTNSIIDYVVRWMQLRFLPEIPATEMPTKEEVK